MQRLFLLFCLLNLQTVVTADALESQYRECAICFEQRQSTTLDCKCPPENRCCYQCFWKATLEVQKPFCLLCQVPCGIPFPTEQENRPITDFIKSFTCQLTNTPLAIGLEIKNPRDKKVPFALLYVSEAKKAFWGMGNMTEPKEVPTWVLARLLTIAIKNGKQPLDAYSTSKKELPFLPALLEQVRLSAGPNNPKNQEVLQRFITALKTK